MLELCSLGGVNRGSIFASFRGVIAALCVAWCGVVHGQTIPGNLPAWRLVWSDEFDQPNGTRPNPARWGYDLGGGGWGNQELESYTGRTNNARIDGGMLVIEAHQEEYKGADGIARHYTSARLKTQGRFSTLYGRIESRIRLPRGQGIWPAFWLMGVNIETVGWPACGEVDILENIGREPTVVHSTIHGPGYSGGNGIGHPYVSPNGHAFADDFHVYALEWSPGLMRFLVDNQTFFTVAPASLPSGTAWVYNGPEFILLNVAVGGTWPGSPDASTVFPQRMLVDYVRVYHTAAAPAPTLQVEQLTNHVFVKWSGLFPQALLQRSPRPRGPWSIQTTSGLRTTDSFFTEIRPGFYRLELGN